VQVTELPSDAEVVVVGRCLNTEVAVILTALNGKVGVLARLSAHIDMSVTYQLGLGRGEHRPADRLALLLAYQVTLDTNLRKY